MENALDNVADWIAAGIDPEQSTLFVQSLVPEHAELYLLLQMVTPIPWLERVPTYKEQIEQLAEKDLSNLGFLGLSAAADGRRDHLQRALRAGRRGSGAASRALARSRPPVPQLLWRDLRRAAAAPHADAAAAGSRQPEDEQELRQHHRPVRRRRGRHEKGPADVHGSEAGAGRHSRARSKATPSSSTTTPSTRIAPRSTT